MNGYGSMGNIRGVAQQMRGKHVSRVPVDIRHELLRKALHLLIAFVPLLAGVDVGLAMALLSAGTLFYLLAEQARQRGHEVLIISDLTVLALRKRDEGHFVLGPVTLGVGAMLALLLYPAPASAIAIYALAFGDGLASLAGKLIGTIRIPFTGGKTLEGSLTCFLAVFLVTARLSGSFPLAGVVALTATILELLPLGDFDNIILPVGTGLAVVTITPAFQSVHFLVG